MNAKKWYRSKTIWANLAALAAVAVQAFTGQEAVDPAIGAGVLAVANAFLRLVTEEPIG